MNIVTFKSPTKSLGLKTSSLRHINGFSMTEIILTVSLFLILAGVGIGAYFRFYQGALINSDVDNVQTILKNTRFKALKNPTAENYGVHIDTAQNTLTSFRNSYTPGLSENVVVQLDSLTIQELSLSPSIGVTDQVLFEKKTGKSQNTGNFRIGNNNQSFTISINVQGVVNLQ